MTASDDLPSFSFVPSYGHDAEALIDQAYTAVTSYAHTVISWYLSEKEKKARASKALGIGSIVLLVLGGAVPLLVPVVPFLNPSIGYVLLALGGGFQLLDRYRGYSRSWSKHVASAITLNSALLSFQIDWIEHRVAGVEVQQRWSILREFTSTIGNTISGETREWSEQLDAESVALGEMFKAHQTSTPPDTPSGQRQDQAGPASAAADMQSHPRIRPSATSRVLSDDQDI